MVMFTVHHILDDAIFMLEIASVLEILSNFLKLAFKKCLQPRDQGNIGKLLARPSIQVAWLLAVRTCISGFVRSDKITA